MRKKLAALLRDCEKKFQDHPAFAFCDEEEVRQVSFREFLEDVENRRAVYREIWEERIGLWAGNSYRWIVAATSLLLEGKTVVLLDANLMDEDARWLCSSTDTQMVIAEEEMLEANVAMRGRRGKPFDRFRNRVMFPIIDLLTKKR